MDLEKLKVIVRNLESLVECLKSEIQSESKDPHYEDTHYEEVKKFLTDYDEVFYDDEED